jgi:hypothetical protein
MKTKTNIVDVITLGNEHDLNLYNYENISYTLIIKKIFLIFLKN